MNANQAGEAAKAPPKGLKAILGAAMAIVGVLATAHPTSALLKALSEAVPQLATAVPMVVTACGAILAALSDPPELPRRK